MVFPLYYENCVNPKYPFIFVLDFCTYKQTAQLNFILNKN